MSLYYYLFFLAQEQKTQVGQGPAHGTRHEDNLGDRSKPKVESGQSYSGTVKEDIMAHILPLLIIGDILFVSLDGFQG